MQRQLLAELNKEEIVRIMEQLCKDFLQTVIKKKAYDIKMSQLDILNLPTTDAAGDKNEEVARSNAWLMWDVQ